MIAIPFLGWVAIFASILLLIACFVFLIKTRGRGMLDIPTILFSVAIALVAACIPALIMMVANWSKKQGEVITAAEAAASVVQEQNIVYVYRQIRWAVSNRQSSTFFPYLSADVQQILRSNGFSIVDYVRDGIPGFLVSWSQSPSGSNGEHQP